MTRGTAEPASWLGRVGSILTWAALLLFTALILQSRGPGGKVALSTPMLQIAFGIVLAAGVIGLVVTAIWGRPAGKASASGVFLVLTCLLLGSRLLGKPKIGVLVTDAGPGVVYVARVDPGGTAEQAQIRPGDVLASVDGVTIQSSDHFCRVIQQKQVFDQIEVGILRQDGLRYATVMIGD